MAIKRYVIAAAAATVVFTGVYGAAASLQVNDGATLQVGATDLECQENPVNVTVGGYAAYPVTFNTVTVTGIEASCFGERIVARALDGGVQIGPGDNFASNGPTLVINAGTEVLTFGTPISAADADSIELVIFD